MTPIFIASCRPYSGKTLICLGLALRFADAGLKVGYMKPVGRLPVKAGTGVFDSDVFALMEGLSLSDPIETISPFVIDYESRNLMLAGKTRGTLKGITSAYRTVRKGKDILLIEGPADMTEAAAFGVDALSLISALGARVLIVEQWEGEASIDVLMWTKKLIETTCAEGMVIGAALNKVAETQIAYVKDTVVPYFEKKGLKIFGVLGRDRLLGAVTVGSLVERLGGKVLCAEDRLDELVESFSIGAMDVASALNYFRKTPNKAVITGAHRADIQLAALETSTKCLILTGGLYTNDVVLGKASSLGVPVISVTGDTMSTVEAIEGMLGKTGISGKDKIERAKAVVVEAFDIKRFVRVIDRPFR